MKKKFRPGQTAPASGQWAMVNQQGRRTNVERTVVAGEPFPPTPRHGMGYVLVDRTRH